MATNLDAGQIRELLHVARRYYLDDVDQLAISREISVSRSTVSRMLRRARELDMVRIEVGHPFERTSALEDQLAGAFGLRHAWVIEPADHEDRHSAVAKHAAGVLPTIIERDSVVAVSNGTTLADVVAAMEPHPRVDSRMVQMIGSLGPGNQLIDGPDLCRRLSDLFQCTYHAIPAPIVTRTARLASALRRETAVATTLALAGHADLALVGIGTVDEHGSGRILDGWMTPQLNRELLAAGAVGHVVGHHFDANGDHVRSSLCDRTLGVPLDRLRSIPLVVGVVAGPEKVAATVGALRGGYVTALITDSATATAVLGAAKDVPMDGAP